MEPIFFFGNPVGFKATIFQEYIQCIFKITEQRLNETFVFLMVNLVMPSQLDWEKIKELVQISEKEPAIVPILKKKFPKQ